MKSMRISVFVGEVQIKGATICENFHELKLAYRVLGCDFNLELDANQLKVHSIFAENQQSIDRCKEVYFRSFEVIIKAKSKDDADVLLGKAEWMCDNEGPMQLKEATFPVG
jgi:hypothetical protein